MRVTQLGGSFVLSPERSSDVQQIKALPARSWDAAKQEWRCPAVKELWHVLQAQGANLLGVTPPVKSGYEVLALSEGKLLLVKTLQTTQDVLLCRKLPEGRSWSTKHQGWVCRATQLNVKYILGAFPQAVWSPGALPLKKRWALNQPVQQAKDYNHLLGRARPDVDITGPLDLMLKVTPFAHQLKAYFLCRDRDAFALFMQQGTGKSLVAFMVAMYHYMRGEITGLVIVCPNGVKEPWAEMIQDYAPDDLPRDVFIWEAKTRHKAHGWVTKQQLKTNPLRILIINSEALSSAIGGDLVKLFLAKHVCLMAVDESSRFKSISAARTKRLIRLRPLARYRLIMSGTPVTQGPIDLFSQCKFLDPDILGFSSMVGFRDRHTILGGWNNRQIVGYVRLDELTAKLDQHAFRVTKDECLDLPERTWSRRTVELSPQQRVLYEQMRDQLLIELEGQKNIVQFAIVQLQVLQRIIGGFVPLETINDDDLTTSRSIRQIEGPNPKLNELLEICDELPGERLIIWARFRAELDLIATALRKKYGDTAVVEYHGGVANDLRNKNRRAFQATAGTVRFFVGQPQAGGIGLTLTAASTVVYYSNTYSLEDRLQSEDRPHRIGQTKHVNYIDLVMKGTMDVRLIGGLRVKKGLADVINGDPQLGWL